MAEERENIRTQSFPGPMARLGVMDKEEEGTRRERKQQSEATSTSHRGDGRPGSTGDARPEVIDVEQAGPVGPVAARDGMNLSQKRGVAAGQEDVVQAGAEGEQGSLLRAIRYRFIKLQKKNMN